MHTCENTLWWNTCVWLDHVSLNCHVHPSCAFLDWSMHCIYCFLCLLNINAFGNWFLWLITNIQKLHFLLVCALMSSMSIVKDIQENRYKCLVSQMVWKQLHGSTFLIVDLELGDKFAHICCEKTSWYLAQV